MGGCCASAPQEAVPAGQPRRPRCHAGGEGGGDDGPPSAAVPVPAQGTAAHGAVLAIDAFDDLQAAANQDRDTDDDDADDEPPTLSPCGTDPCPVVGGGDRGCLRSRDGAPASAVRQDGSDGSPVATPLRESELPSARRRCHRRAQQLTVAGSTFASACLDIRAEEPRRTRAGLALCALAASAHLGPDARAEDGAVVPPPLVGCLLWLLRHDASSQRWAEHDATLAVTPKTSPFFSVTSTWQRTRSACCLAPLQSALRAARRDSQAVAEVVLEPAHSARSPLASEASPPPDRPVPVYARVWQQPPDGNHGFMTAGDGDGDSAAVLPPGTHALEFGDFLRLGVVRQRNGMCRRFIDARVGADAGDDDDGGGACNWARLLEMREVMPESFAHVPSSRGMMTEDSVVAQLRRVSFDGRRRDAIRALDDLAAALGYEHQRAVGRRSMRLQRENNIQPELDSAYVASSRAAEFLRNLGDDAPFTLRELALLRDSLTPVGSPVRRDAPGQGAADAWNAVMPEPASIHPTSHLPRPGRHMVVTDSTDTSSSDSGGDGDDVWSF